MIPLALGTGSGAEERRAVAVVVIGGQMLSLALTLLVTPVAYTLLDDAAAMAARLRARRVRGRTPSPRALPTLAGGANGEDGERTGRAAPARADLTPDG
jgi:hypothetical protein